MPLLAPIAAVVIALFWCIVALLIAWSRGYTPGGIALCLGGIIAGGVGAGLVGKYALTDWSAIMSDQRETVVACAAVLVGALCGLSVTERLRDHQFPTPQQLLTATFGFLFGGMGGFVILFFTYQTWARGLSLYVLVPGTIASATLAGSAISHRLPDLK